MHKNKFINRSLYAVLIAGVSSTLFSCTDDMHDNIIGTETDVVSFCLDPTWGDAADTRSSAMSNGREIERAVLRAEGSRDTLCVTAVETDGIDLGSASPATRGTQVGVAKEISSFGCFAYTEQNGTKFYIPGEKYSRDSKDLFQCTNIYYWPGQQLTLNFYCYAPHVDDAPGLTVPQNATDAKQLSYTVPDNVADQKDLMLAERTNDLVDVVGNKNTVVPLHFNHLLSAVRIVAGNNMAKGKISSISFTNLYGAGTIDMDAPTAWTYTGDKKSFSYAPEGGIAVGSTPDQEIMAGANTMLLLPQTFDATAKPQIVVEFDDENGGHRTLKADLSEGWQMGKTYTYTLTVTPAYTLEFTSTPETKDAHYEIYPITIKTDDKVPGGWTLTSNFPNDVTFVESGKFATDTKENTTIQALVDEGYWLDKYQGTGTLTSNTTGEVKVYVFLTENVTEQDRDIKLSLKPATGNYAAKEFSFKQYCPAWNQGIGVERIQDKDYPWGFNWDKSMKITYDFMSLEWYQRLFIGWYLNFFSDYNYISVDGVVGSARKVTIDFSKISTLDKAVDPGNGKQNTWDIYTFDGVNQASALMTELESLGGKASAQLPSNPAEFAARSCAMKNKYNVRVRTGSDGNSYSPELEEANLVWYLPAQNEAPKMNDGLSGNYWTSTAIITPGTTAYKYTAGGSTTGEDRNTPLHVRAVRQKP